jgi:hypothetical protein
VLREDNDAVAVRHCHDAVACRRLRGSTCRISALGSDLIIARAATDADLHNAALVVRRCALFPRATVQLLNVFDSDVVCVRRCVRGCTRTLLSLRFLFRCDCRLLLCGERVAGILPLRVPGRSVVKVLVPLLVEEDLPLVDFRFFTVDMPPAVIVRAAKVLLVVAPRTAAAVLCILQHAVLVVVSARGGRAW